MICPLRFGKQLHEGGEECVEQCAWLVATRIYEKEGVIAPKVCAIAALAMGNQEYDVGAMNAKEVD